MEFKNLEILLDKYFEGNTTLDEEQQIREFFRKNADLPEKLMETKAMFEFFQKESEKQVEFQFAPTLTKKSTKNTTIRKVYYLVSGIAAAIVLLISIVTYSDNSEEQKVYAYINGKPIMNEQVAKMEAKKALLFVSSKFNKGTENLKHLSIFSKAEDVVLK